MKATVIATVKIEDYCEDKDIGRVATVDETKDALMELLKDNLSSRATVEILDLTLDVSKEE